MRGVVAVPWSDEERALLKRLHSNGLGLKQICGMMGRSKHSIHRQMQNLGLVRSDRNPTVARDKGERGYPRNPRTTLPPLPSLSDDASR